MGQFFGVEVHQIEIASENELYSLKKIGTNGIDVMAN